MEKVQTNQRTDVPTLVLERYRLGELEPHDVERLESDHDVTALQAQVEALSTADLEARREYPPSRLAADVRRRLAEGPRPRPVRMIWLLPAMAAVVLAVALSPELSRPWGRSPESATEGADDARVKGPVGQLLVYRNTDRGAEQLADGDVAVAGQVLQVGYRVTEPAFGAIVSVDGRGHVTQHLPAAGGRAVALAAGDAVLLDAGFELDDAPRVERFFLVSASTAFELAPLISRVRAATDVGPVDVSSLGLPAGVAATAFSVVKGPQRP